MGFTTMHSHVMGGHTAECDATSQADFEEAQRVCLAVQALFFDFCVAAVEHVYDYVNERPEEVVTLCGLRLAAKGEEQPDKYDEGYDCGFDYGMTMVSRHRCVQARRAAGHGLSMGGPCGLRTPEKRCARGERGVTNVSVLVYVYP